MRSALCPGFAVTSSPKLRLEPPDKPFHVVLVEPEIPQNTGAIARTCVATHSPLHLVGPLGFSIDARAVRRAGLDYWPWLTLHRHDHLEGVAPHAPLQRTHVFSSQAKRSVFDADFRPGDALVFGRESVGLDDAVLELLEPRCWAIPIGEHVRSLNLANAVAIVLYHALWRTGLGKSAQEPVP